MCTSVTHTDTLRDTVYCVVNKKSIRSDLIGDIREARTVVASPPGHSPKAERWPGTDCLRMLQNYTKTGVISKTPCTFREFVRARLDIRPFQFTSTMTSATVTLLLPIPSMTL